MSSSGPSEGNSQLNTYDTLNPKIVRQDGLCYRVDKKPSTTKKATNKPSLKPYEDNEDFKCAEIHDFDIEVLDNGRFKTSIRMPQTFFSYIIGTKGSRRRQIQEETKTEIKIPRKPPNTNILITGPTEQSVVHARRRLEMIGYDLRNRAQVTHFLSYPLITDEIKMNFNKFKELVLSEGHIDGIDETIFQKVDKLHLTIGTLVLLDTIEIDEASQILDDCKKDIIDPYLAKAEPITIRIQGLEYMNDDPSQVDVLYAKVTIVNHSNSDFLQNLSDDIVNYFHKKGIMKKDAEQVKLHATLINSRYRKEAKEEGSTSRDRHRRYPKRISFDARPILEKYGDFDFGTQPFTAIHLSHRFSVDTNGYYQAVKAISCV